MCGGIVVNCGVLMITFWSSKIFLGFWIYFLGFHFGDRHGLRWARSFGVKVLFSGREAAGNSLPLPL